MTFYSIRSMRTVIRYVPRSILPFGFLLSPIHAQAADECGVQMGPVPIQCVSPPARYADGITYLSNGNLVVDVGAGITSFGTGGLSLTAGQPGDSLTATTITNLVTTSSGANQGTTAPAVIDLFSQNGIINLTTGGTVQGVTTAVQYGIRAQASGTGNINITTGANVATGTGTTNPGVAAIMATSNGGNINLNLGGNASGRVHGVIASTTGLGNLTFTGGGTASNAAGDSAIDVRTELGSMILNINRNVQSGGDNGVGIRATTGGGNAIINVLDGNVDGGSVSSNTIPASTAANIELHMSGGTATINHNQASSSGAIGRANSNRFRDMSILARGSGNVVINNLNGGIYGRIDVSEMGSFTFINDNAAPDAGRLSSGNFPTDRNDQGWTTTGINSFTDGDDRIENRKGLFILGSRNERTSNDLDLALETVELRFNGGNDTFVNQGVIGTGYSEFDSRKAGVTAVLSDLEIFQNSGVIMLGMGKNSGTGFDQLAKSPEAGTDRFTDDILVYRNGVFDASGDSLIMMDVDLGIGAGSSACTRFDDGTLAADCIDFQGTDVSGLSRVVLTQRVPDDLGAYIPTGILLVDIRGGSVTGNNFVLDPTTEQYRDIFGGVIDKGLMFYSIIYDEEAEQVKLFGLPNDNALQYPLAIQAAETLWRTSTASWFERESEIREGERSAGYGGGIWFRGATLSGDRSVAQMVSGAGADFTFQNNHELDIWTITLGSDLIRTEGAGHSLVIGGMLGYANGRMNVDASSNSFTMDGVTVGLYGSFVSGAFFADLALNSTWLDMNVDIPVLELFPAGSIVSNTLNSIGAQLEVGWRWKSGGVSLEPMLVFNHVETQADDAAVPAGDPAREGIDFAFPDQASSQGGLGLRLSLENQNPTAVRTRLTFTGRYLEEFDEETTVMLGSTSPESAPLVATFEGPFTDIGVGLAVGSIKGAVSGYLNSQLRFADGYESVGFSAGLRYQW